MIKIAPSILSADFCNLERDIQRVSSADYLHVDVMDGAFVPNITIGVPVLKSIRKHTDMFLDVHLMIEKPVHYIEAFAQAGADLLSVHLEADHPTQIAQALKLMGHCGVKKAVALRPITKAEAILPYLEELDLVLVMTVEPGFGGQAFMESQLDTIRQVRALIEKYNPACELEVDGGIAPKTAPLVVEAGANVLVAGSAGQPACSSASAEPEHLAFYDSFETWNQEVPSNGVQVEEVERDGLLQYRFWNEASGLELFVLPGWRDEAGQPHDPTTEAIYQGRSLTFEMPVLPMCSGGVLGHASLLLQDLTGDRTPELVYLYGGGGTGQQRGQARVFDLAAMEERAVLWDSSSAAEWMSGLVQLQLAGTREAGSFGEKREAVYQITAPDGSTLYAGTGGFSLTEFPDAPPPLFGDNEAIVLDGDRLVLSSGFWVDLGVGFFGPYLGWLTCGFQYDPAQQSFSLSPECTLQVYTPVDPSAISLLQA